MKALRSVGNVGVVGTNSKLRSEQELVDIIAKLRSSGKRVVWTNGCFDILHRGHVLYLEAARNIGDTLVVGLNGDASVRELKGPDRPVCSLEQRVQALVALRCVDYVVAFDDLTAVRLLKLLKPDIYAKGGDYTIETINQQERAVVESYGGRIEILPEVKGVSTTRIIQQNRKRP